LPATDTSDYFLNQIPDIAIISVGAHNRYGHPATQALDFLKSHNIKYSRTDQDGKVDVALDGKSFSVN
jgi:beta-lactamase superfamily II metal-dependent hydrolase